MQLGGTNYQNQTKQTNTGILVLDLETKQNNTTVFSNGLTWKDTNIWTPSEQNFIFTRITNTSYSQLYR